MTDVTPLAEVDRALAKAEDDGRDSDDDRPVSFELDRALAKEDESEVEVRDDLVSVLDVAADNDDPADE